MFWDTQCAETLQMSCKDLRKLMSEVRQNIITSFVMSVDIYHNFIYLIMQQVDEDHPLIYPELLDKMLNRKFALRLKLQSTFDSASVQRMFEDTECIKKVEDKFGVHEVIFRN